MQIVFSPSQIVQVNLRKIPEEETENSRLAIKQKEKGKHRTSYTFARQPPQHTT